jgi:hypothetical protein
MTCGLIINTDNSDEITASSFMKECAFTFKIETVFVTRLHGFVSRNTTVFIVTARRIYDPNVSTSVRLMGS